MRTTTTAAESPSADAVAGEPESSHGSNDDRVGALRGAGVGVDVRRVAPAIAVVCLIGLGIFSAILFVAGAHNNAQLTKLRAHGIRVEITVSGCMGLLGGSGSNAAGYACRGAFTLDGHHYKISIPGNTLHRPGTKVVGVTVASDPHLVSTPSAVSADAPSARVFLLPSILMAAVILGVVAMLVRRRHASKERQPRVGASP